MKVIVPKKQANEQTNLATPHKMVYSFNSIHRKCSEYYEIHHQSYLVSIDNIVPECSVQQSLNLHIFHICSIEQK